MDGTGSMVARDGGGAGERKMAVAASEQKRQEWTGVDKMVVDVNIEQGCPVKTRSHQSR